MRTYLVVGNRTLGGEPLVQRIGELAAGGDCRFHLVVPATHPEDHAWTEGEAVAAARQRLEAALERLRGLGADVDGEVGDSNPMLAVEDTMREGGFDEIILSTLPPGPSRWLKLDLPHRVTSRFAVPVTHVVGEAAEA